MLRGVCAWLSWVGCAWLHRPGSGLGACGIGFGGFAVGFVFDVVCSAARVVSGHAFSDLWGLAVATHTHLYKTLPLCCLDSCFEMFPL